MISLKGRLADSVRNDREPDEEDGTNNPEGEDSIPALACLIELVFISPQRTSSRANSQMPFCSSQARVFSDCPYTGAFMT